jgi:hypothetical protein
MLTSRIVKKEKKIRKKRRKKRKEKKRVEESRRVSNDRANKRGSQYVKQMYERDRRYNVQVKKR